MNVRRVSRHRFSGAPVLIAQYESIVTQNCRKVNRKFDFASVILSPLSEDDRGGESGEQGPRDTGVGAPTFSADDPRTAI